MKGAWLRRRGGAISAAIALVAIVIAVCAYRSALVKDVPRGDVTYDVAVARSIVRGEGLSTNILPLGAFDALLVGGRAAVDPWPSFHKFILPQVVLAPFVGVLGPTLHTARIASIAEYAALVVALFALLARALRSVPYAFGFAAAFVAFDELNGLAISGLSACGDVLFFFLAIAGWLAVIERPKLAPVAGVLLALTVLERYSFLLLIPFYLLGLLLTSGRAAAAKAGVGAAAILGPVMLWSHARYGTLFPSPQGEQLLLFGTKYFPTDTWYTAGWPRLGDGLDDLPRELWRKAGVSARTLAEIMTSTPGRTVRNVFMGAAALVAGVRVAREDKALRAVLLVGGAFVCTYVGAHLLIGFSYRYVVFALPGVWVLACVLVRDASRAAARAVRRAPAGLWAAAAIALLVAPEVLRFSDGVAWARANPPGCSVDRYCNDDEILAFLRANYPASGLVVSGGDRPWELALDSRNRVVPIPRRPEELERFRRAGVPFDLALVPADLSFAGDGARPRDWVIWDAVRDARLPSFEGLALDHVFSDGSVLYARAPNVPAGVDYCGLRAAIDLHRDGDRRYLGATFRYTERKDERAWSWIEGPHATATLVACRAARRVEARLLTPRVPTEVAVTINGRSVGALRLDRSMTWQDVALEIPEEVLVDGANEIALDVAADRAIEREVALETIALVRF